MEYNYAYAAGAYRATLEMLALELIQVGLVKEGCEGAIIELLKEKVQEVEERVKSYSNPKGE
jgi:hypothetical protein